MTVRESDGAKDKTVDSKNHEQERIRIFPTVFMILNMFYYYVEQLDSGFILNSSLVHGITWEYRENT